LTFLILENQIVGKFVMSRDVGFFIFGVRKDFLF